MAPKIKLPKKKEKSEEDPVIFAPIPISIMKPTMSKFFGSKNVVEKPIEENTGLQRMTRSKTTNQGLKTQKMGSKTTSNEPSDPSITTTTINNEEAEQTVQPSIPTTTETHQNKTSEEICQESGSEKLIGTQEDKNISESEMKLHHDGIIAEQKKEEQRVIKAQIAMIMKKDLKRIQTKRLELAQPKRLPAFKLMDTIEEASTMDSTEPTFAEVKKSSTQEDEQQAAQISKIAQPTVHNIKISESQQEKLEVESSKLLLAKKDKNVVKQVEPKQKEAANKRKRRLVKAAEKTAITDSEIVDDQVLKSGETQEDTTTATINANEPSQWSTQTINAIEEKIREVEMLYCVAPQNWRSKQKVNLYSKIEVLASIKKVLTPTQMEMFKTSCFGKLLDIEITKFPAQLLRHLILRQCRVSKKDELMFSFGDNTATFTIRDFAVITGLKCDDYPAINWDDFPSSAVMKKVFDVDEDNGAVTKKELNFAWDALHNRESEETPSKKRAKSKQKDVKAELSDTEIVQLAKLYVLENLLVTKQANSKISNNYFKLVEDNDMFDNYPWGRESYYRTVEQFKNAVTHYQSDNFVICGFPHAVIAWVYEIVPLFAQKEYAKKVRSDIPRIINWESSQRFDWEDLEKKIFGIRNIKFTPIKITGEEWAQPYMTAFSTGKRPMVEESARDETINAKEFTSLDDLDSTVENSSAIKNIMLKVEGLERSQNAMKNMVLEEMKNMKSMILEIYNVLVKKDAPEEEEIQQDHEDATGTFSQYYTRKRKADQTKEKNGEGGDNKNQEENVTQEEDNDMPSFELLSPKTKKFIGM